MTIEHFIFLPHLFPKVYLNFITNNMGCIHLGHHPYLSMWDNSDTDIACHHIEHDFIFLDFLYFIAGTKNYCFGVSTQVHHQNQFYEICVPKLLHLNKSHSWNNIIRILWIIIPWQLPQGVRGFERTEKIWTKSLRNISTCLGLTLLSYCHGSRKTKPRHTLDPCRKLK